MTTGEKIGILSRHVTPERLAKMRRALGNRTYMLSVILEDIYQPHNAAAVMRSCDAFGVQRAFIIENRYPMRISHHVDMGTSKWMQIEKFRSRTCSSTEGAKNRGPNESDAENTLRTIARAKSLGYTVAAATLRGNPADLSALPDDRPIAVMIGTELTGLSDAAHEGADIAFKMDMLGFAQSLNLSVFAALCISSLSSRMRSGGCQWKMTPEQREEVLLSWLFKSISSATEILADAEAGGS